MSHFISITLSFLCQDPHPILEKGYSLESIQEQEILSLKTNPVSIINLDKINVKEFGSNPVKTFRDIFEILPEDGYFSFGNHRWHGLNPETHQMQLSIIFEENTTKRLRKMPPFQFGKYIHEMLLSPECFFSDDIFKEACSNLLPELELNNDVFQKIFLEKENLELRMWFFENINHQKFAYQEIMHGNLNPFSQWNKPSDYKGTNIFSPSSTLHKAYKLQLKDFFRSLGFSDVIYNPHQKRWVVKKSSSKPTKKTNFTGGKTRLQ